MFCKTVLSETNVDAVWISLRFCHHADMIHAVIVSCQYRFWQSVAGDDIMCRLKCYIDTCTS